MMSKESKTSEWVNKSGNRRGANRARANKAKVSKQTSSRKKAKVSKKTSSSRKRKVFDEEEEETEETKLRNAEKGLIEINIFRDVDIDCFWNLTMNLVYVKKGYETLKEQLRKMKDENVELRIENEKLKNTILDKDAEISKLSYNPLQKGQKSLPSSLQLPPSFQFQPYLPLLQPSKPLSSMPPRAKITVPDKVYPGSRLICTFPDGKKYKVTVPTGVKPGDEFEVSTADCIKE